MSKVINFQSEFTRNFFTLFTGTAIAQIIPILISPILSRLYTPDEIGAYSLYYTVASILSVFTLGRYYSAIILPENDKEAFSLFQLCILLTFLFSLFFTIIILFAGQMIMPLVGKEATGSKWNLFYILLMMLSYNIYVSYDSWLNRFKLYKSMTTNKVTQVSICSFVQIAFEFCGGGVLMLGRILGQLGSILIFYFNVKNLRKVYVITNLKDIYRVAKKYVEFPLYSMPNNLLNTISFNLPILLFGYFFDMTTTGYFSWSTLIILSPMSMITAALGQVLYQKVSELKNKGLDIHEFVKKTYIKLLFISVLFFPIIGVFAPIIFKLLFGEEWENAGIYTQCMIPSLIFIFANNPISLIIFVQHKQKNYLIFELLLFIFRTLSIVLGYYLTLNSVLTTLFYSLCGMSFNIYLSFYLLKISKNI